MGKKSAAKSRNRERAALEQQERIAFLKARGPMNHIKRRLFRQAGPASAPAPARIRLGRQVISFGPHAGTRWSQIPTECLEQLLREGTSAEFVLNLATEALLRRARREQFQSIQPKRTTGSRPAITAGSGPQGRRYRDPGVGPSDTGHPAKQITCHTAGSSHGTQQTTAGRPRSHPAHRGICDHDSSQISHTQRGTNPQRQTTDVRTGPTARRRVDKLDVLHQSPEAAHAGEIG